MRYFLLYSLFLLISPFSGGAQDAEDKTTSEIISEIKAELDSTALTTSERIEKLHEIGQLFF